MRDGLAHVYAPVVGRKEASRFEVRHLNGFFRNSHELLVLNLIKDETINNEELKRVRQLLQQHRKYYGKVAFPEGLNCTKRRRSHHQQSGWRPAICGVAWIASACAAAGKSGLEIRGMVERTGRCCVRVRMQFLIIERSGLTELFQAIVNGVASERLHLRGKPEPDVFLTCLELLTGKVEPSRAMRRRGCNRWRDGAAALVWYSVLIPLELQLPWISTAQIG